MNKKCKQCLLEKSAESFYIHKKMSDGRLNICKECIKLNVKNRYFGNYSVSIKRERARYQRRKNTDGYKKIKRLWVEKNKEKLAEYRREYTAKNRQIINEWQKKNRLRYSDKIKARATVQTKLRSGAMVRKPCFCGEIKSEAHHEDYSKPLDVIWLCIKHHKELHKNKRLLNK
jgi:hypothetical protein